MSESSPNREVFKTAVAMIRKGRSGDAIPLLDRLIELDSEDFMALRERGLAKKFRGDHAGAIADFTAVLLHQPSNPERFADRAEARWRAGDLQGAIDDYSAAISVSPNHGSVYLQRGRVKVECGDLTGAIEDFTVDIQYCAMGPLSGLLNRGKTKHLLGDLAGADRDLTEAMHLERGRPIHAPLLRGRVRLDMEEYEAAIADFTVVIEAFPELTNAYRHRAEAKSLVGDREGAEIDLSAYNRLGGRDLPAYK